MAIALRLSAGCSLAQRCKIYRRAQYCLIIVAAAYLSSVTIERHLMADLLPPPPAYYSTLLNLDVMNNRIIYCLAFSFKILVQILINSLLASRALETFNLEIRKITNLHVGL